MVAAQRGDVLALSRLMDRLAPWIARLCGGIALEQADDAAQDALVQVFRDLRTLRDPDALRGWARRIAVRESVRHAQRTRASAQAHAGGDAQALAANASDPALAPVIVLESPPFTKTVWRSTRPPRARRVRPRPTSSRTNAAIELV